MTTNLLSLEQNGQPDWQEMSGKKHGWQPATEEEFFREEILPNLSEEEKEAKEFLKT